MDYLHLGTIAIEDVRLDASLRQTLDEDAIIAIIRQCEYASLLLGPPHIRAFADHYRDNLPTKTLQIVSFSTMQEYPRWLVVKIQNHNLLLRSPLQANGWTFEDWYDVFTLSGPDNAIPTPHSGAFNRSLIGRIPAHHMRFDRTRRLAIASAPVSRTFELQELRDGAGAGTTAEQFQLVLQSESAAPAQLSHYDLEGRLIEAHTVFRRPDGSVCARIVRDYENEKPVSESIMSYDDVGRRTRTLTTSLTGDYLRREHINYRTIDGRDVADTVTFDGQGSVTNMIRTDRRGQVLAE